MWERILGIFLSFIMGFAVASIGYGLGYWSCSYRYVPQLDDCRSTLDTKIESQTEEQRRFLDRWSRNGACLVVVEDVAR